MLHKRIKNEPENYKREAVSSKAKIRYEVLGSNSIYKKKHISSTISINKS